MPALTAIPQLIDLSHQQLGVLAGHLHRTRVGRHPHAHNNAPSYGVVLADAVTATTAAAEPVILTAGATWLPHHRLDRAIRRAVLIHVSAPRFTGSSLPPRPAHERGVRSRERRGPCI